MTAHSPASQHLQRLVSLDAFRGLTMAAMVIVNNPGDWEHLYAPLAHAEWHGCTPTDLIFPFFLFIVGVSITLSTKGARPAAIVRRAAILVALGLFLSGYPWFTLSTWRIPGVLQRIGLCYLAAAFAYRFSVGQGLGRAVRRILLLAVVLLVGYWVLLLALRGANWFRYDLSPAGNLGAVVDRAVFGTHLWRRVWDPEGLLSTVPAIGTTLLGVVAGLWLKASEAGERRLAGLLAGGAAACLVGLAWSLAFPLNKSLWTSSYAVFTAGLGAIVLGFCYWAVDMRGWHRAAHPLVVLGSNAIALFVLSGLLTETLIAWQVSAPDGTSDSALSWLYRSFVEPLASSPYNASLLFAVLNLVVLYVVVWVMYRRGIFLKV